MTLVAGKADKTLRVWVPAPCGYQVPLITSWHISKSSLAADILLKASRPPSTSPMVAMKHLRQGSLDWKKDVWLSRHAVLRGRCKDSQAL